MSEYVKLGKIGKKIGLDGRFNLTSFCEKPADIFSYSDLLLEDGKKITLRLVSQKTDNKFVAKINDINNPEEIDKLHSFYIQKQQNSFAKDNDQEFFHFELMGCDIISAGEKIGKVINIYNFGAGDILELELASSKKLKMISFSNESIKNINIEKKEIIIDPDFLC